MIRKNSRYEIPGIIAIAWAPCHRAEGMRIKINGLRVKMFFVKMTSEIGPQICKVNRSSPIKRSYTFEALYSNPR